MTGKPFPSRDEAIYVAVKNTFTALGIVAVGVFWFNVITYKNPHSDSSLGESRRERTSRLRSECLSNPESYTPSCPAIQD